VGYPNFRHFTLGRAYNSDFGVLPVWSWSLGCEGTWGRRISSDYTDHLDSELVLLGTLEAQEQLVICRLQAQLVPWVLHVCVPVVTATTSSSTFPVSSNFLSAKVAKWIWEETLGDFNWQNPNKLCFFDEWKLWTFS
jgi:hypothetical protein